MVSSRNRIVLLDTSIVLSIFEKRFDLRESIIDEIGRCEIVIPESVINELKILAEKSNGLRHLMAKASLKYIKNRDFRIIDSIDRKDADRDLILLSVKIKATVATADRELIKKLRNRNIPVISWKRGRLKIL